MRPLVVLDVVGLTPGLLARDGGRHAPALSALARAGAALPLATITPAVTCAVQSTLLSGELPRGHGCVGNGWYNRELAEVQFWKQSNHLVAGEKIWQAARRRDPGFTVAKLFWWYNMYADVDVAVTPRPQYPADGRKLPDLHTHPAELRDELQAELGQFPLFRFWGPMADRVSTEWIGACALRVMERASPTLTLVYLPHLDYDLQRYGPEHPAAVRALGEVDAVAGRLIEAARARGAAVVVLSEYGIVPVRGAIPINRALREAGWLAVRREDAGELLDAGASRAFAVADHQVAHVYVREPELVPRVREFVARLDGVEAVWGEAEKAAHGLDHPRAGELVAVSAPDRWFSYYYWLDDARAPDFARTVDIHRKPGYDPVELFLDPRRPLIRARIAWTLLQRKLGFRALLDVIPLDASLVRGSHGRVTDRPEDGPIFITSEPRHLDPGATAVRATDVKRLLLAHLFD